MGGKWGGVRYYPDFCVVNYTTAFLFISDASPFTHIVPVPINKMVEDYNLGHTVRERGRPRKN